MIAKWPVNKAQLKVELPETALAAWQAGMIMQP